MSLSRLLIFPLCLPTISLRPCNLPISAAKTQP